MSEEIIIYTFETDLQYYHELKDEEFIRYDLSAPYRSLILWELFVESSDGRLTHGAWDKLYFGLFSVIRGFFMIIACTTVTFNFRWIVWGVVVPILYGGLIELLQMYVFTQRSAELGDWYADIGGSFAALLFVFLFLKKRKG